jgi:two-component system nitrate/nitrite response regulator NarL
MSHDPESKTVLIVDDHPIFRDGLRRAFQDCTDFTVVGEAENGETAVELACELRPSIMLLDFALPDFSALEVLHRMKELGVATRTILLTADIDRQQITEALHLGARGVIMKDAGVEVLFKSMYAVLAGEYWIGRELMADWVEYLKTDRPRASITRREREVITRILEGLSNREIASALGISDETVKRHISNIYDKLGVSNRMEMALYITSGKLKGPR